LTGHPAAFAVVLVYAGLWLAFDRQHFDYNAVATLAVWIMTLLIQRANRRDTLALHAKLDELLRVDSAARSELTRLDEKEPEEIEVHRDAEVTKGRTGSTAQSFIAILERREDIDQMRWRKRLTPHDVSSHRHEYCFMKRNPTGQGCGCRPLYGFDYS
jgi:low affinity Fe/Cu permease